jgi:hypothetical protein
MKGTAEAVAETRSRGCLWKEEVEREGMFSHSMSGIRDVNLGHASRTNDSPKYRLGIHFPKSVEDEESKSTDDSLLRRREGQQI